MAVNLRSEPKLVEYTDAGVLMHYELACNSADLGELANWTRAKGISVAAGSDCLVQDICEVYTYRPETDSWEELD